MGENSKIEWCDHTFNPWIGCVKVSPGCKNCYAEREMGRWGANWAGCWGPLTHGAKRKKTSEAYWKKPLKWNREAEEKGVRYKVFCGSLCDVMEPMMDEWQRELMQLIAKTPNLDWLLLTKRPRYSWNFDHEITDKSNVWMGISAENQECLEERLHRILPLGGGYAKRFISIEPMLGKSIWIRSFVDQGKCL